MAGDNLYIKKKGLGNTTKIIILSSVLFVVVALVVVLSIAVFSGGNENAGDGGKSDGDGNWFSNLFHKEQTTATATIAPTPTPTPYVPIVETGMTIETRFNAPQGYKRIETEVGTFGDYLRNYPLKDYGSICYLYNEETGSYDQNMDASGVAVFAQPTQLNRWQQCADSIIMLYAEYLYEKQQFDKITFTFSNGFVCDWLSYSQGNRPNKAYNAWEMKAEASTSKETFDKYLDLVYQYANTDSLSKDMSVSPAAKDISVGDAFVVGKSQLSAAASAVNPTLGSEIKYGHAIIVVDVVEDPATGERLFMIAEGNTPATEIAVIENPDTSMGVWFKFDELGRFIKSADPGIPWSCAWLRRFAY